LIEVWTKNLLLKWTRTSLDNLHYQEISNLISNLFSLCLYKNKSNSKMSSTSQQVSCCMHLQEVAPSFSIHTFSQMRTQKIEQGVYQHFSQLLLRQPLHPLFHHLLWKQIFFMLSQQLKHCFTDHPSRSGLNQNIAS